MGNNKSDNQAMSSEMAFSCGSLKKGEKSSALVLYQFLTCCIISKVIKDHAFTFWVTSWNRFHTSIQNSLWKNITRCLSDTVNTMPADALATSGARASASTVLTHKPGYFIFSIRGFNIQNQINTMVKDFNYLHHLSVGKCYKIQIYFYLFYNKFSMTRVELKELTLKNSMIFSFVMVFRCSTSMLSVGKIKQCYIYMDHYGSKIFAQSRIKYIPKCLQINQFSKLWVNSIQSFIVWVLNLLTWRRNIMG